MTRTQVSHSGPIGHLVIKEVLEFLKSDVDGVLIRSNTVIHVLFIISSPEPKAPR